MFAEAARLRASRIAHSTHRVTSPNQGRSIPGRSDMCIWQTIARTKSLAPAAYLALAVALITPGPVAFALTVVEPGNTLAEQPEIPNASKRRTRQTKTTFERKYDRAVAFLKRNPALIADIKTTAKTFGIDPIHMIGAIVGEHTYNVDVLDRAQSYVIKAASYLKEDIRFAYRGTDVTDFVERAEFERCTALRGSEALWTCRENVWNATFRGKSVDGVSYPNDRFSAVFFQPFFAGQTFGLGQLNPLTALMMSDAVAKKTRFAKLDADDGKQVYSAIMDPDTTLAYIAATLQACIAAYSSVAGFDISKNPGLTATLYNTGSPRARAAALASENKKRAADGEALRLPQVNYYGWLINDKEAELRALLE